MWPLHLLFLLALSAPQQNPPDAGVTFRSKLSAMQKLHMVFTPEQVLNRNTCYTMRSYFFRRQDGLAPVPAGMITCTPASVLQQKQVSPAPPARFVPLGAQPEEQR